MNKEDKLKEVKAFFIDRISGFMLGDLEKSVRAKANFLTALGCLAYTEVIGAFLPPLTGEKNKDIEKRRFYRCLFRFPSGETFRILDADMVSETGKGIYEQLRHSGTHNYYFSIKKHIEGVNLFYPVAITRTGKNANGTKSAPMGIDAKKSHFGIATENYVEELREAYNYFFHKIFIEQDEEWVISALSGMDFIARGIKQ